MCTKWDQIRRVAMKCQKWQENLGEDEVKAMDDLRKCPHIVNVEAVYNKVDYKARNGVKYPVFAIVMEYCNNGSFFQYARIIGDGNRINLVRMYFRQLVAALEAMREKNIIHRDLKPNNVMIGEKGELKVIDFGLCVFGERARGDCGTKGFKAPELKAGRIYNSKADIYSAGAMLFVLLYGFPLPFTPGNDKKNFWRGITQYKSWLKRRGNLKEIKSGRAQELLTFLGESGVGYPIILIGEYEREPCYSYEEAKEILQRDGNRPMEIHTLVGMELIDGMLAEDPAQRWDLREINAHEFVTGAPEISEGDVLKALEELKEETKNSNRGNNSSVKSYIKFRGGAKGKSDEPPFFTVPNLPDLDGDYDDIVKDIKKRLKEKNQEKLPYRPGRCLTQVKYDADPEEILGKLVFIFEKLWKIVVHKDIENYTIRVICDKENLPKVDALVRVVWDEKEELSVLEFRNLHSDFFEFQSFFEGVCRKYFRD
mmetsp:Transcript_1866/g.2621  ORF Transcript_1866/g.2621 Transcript_1866/m.2621 type:complete len:483 (-) Transcript_1866:232-1680(-)